MSKCASPILLCSMPPLSFSYGAGTLKSDNRWNQKKRLRRKSKLVPTPARRHRPAPARRPPGDPPRPPRPPASPRDPPRHQHVRKYGSYGPYIGQHRRKYGSYGPYIGQYRRNLSKIRKSRISSKNSKIQNDPKYIFHISKNPKIGFFQFCLENYGN